MRIDAERLRAALAHGEGYELTFFPDTPSTNLEAKALVASGAAGGAVLCERQSAGRGRRGRTWESSGGSLCMSVILSVELEAERIAALSLAAALAVCDAVRSFGVEATVKWPNDILFGDGKLAGILSEAVFTPQGARFIVGVGVNVNGAFPGEYRAASMEEATGTEHDRNLVAAAIIDRLEPAAALLASDAGTAALLSQYRRRSSTLGRQVRAVTATESFMGTAIDIDGAGRLIIALPGGGRRTVEAADVSIRSEEQ